MAGLARLVAVQDHQAAEAHAALAVTLATEKVAGVALSAQGWVAWHGRDLDAATRLAAEAIRMARAQSDVAVLAESLELRAQWETEPGPKVGHAEGSARDLGPHRGGGGCRQISYALGRLPGANTDDRLCFLRATETLTQAGATLPRPEETVTVKTFGRFEVVVGGRVVPPTEWQSRKARELLRILVSRRGRPLPRAELCELLWPDDASPTGHRLSVLLSIVRGVLDPDRSADQDAFLVADRASVGLDITRLRVDVEEFLADAEHGRQLQVRGAAEDALRLLAEAERAYQADVFADEPYADWAVPLREQARATYLAVLRSMARLSDPDHASMYLLRLLTIDPYDEAAHRALVSTYIAAGHHGEARRAQALYRRAMRDIGVSVPRPDVEAVGVHRPSLLAAGSDARPGR